MSNFKSTLSKLYRGSERHLSIVNLVLVFWCLFWMLNGLDKFFNGEAWFGVSRDEKFIGYFSQLGLPPWSALGVLYSVAIIEVVVGLLFALALTVFHDSKAIHRVCFKASLMLFMFLAVGDILLGDRAELWEHGTFMVLALITFEIYVNRGQIYRDVNRWLMTEELLLPRSATSTEPS